VSISFCSQERLQRGAPNRAFRTEFRKKSQFWESGNSEEFWESGRISWGEEEFYSVLGISKFRQNVG